MFYPLAFVSWKVQEFQLLKHQTAKPVVAKQFKSAAQAGVTMVTQINLLQVNSVFLP